MTTSETFALQPGDKVLVSPSPITPGQMHRVLSASDPNAKMRTVKSVERADSRPDWASLFDVHYTDGTCTRGARGLAVWILI